MQKISLSKCPNQTIIVTLNGGSFTIKLHSFGETDEELIILSEVAVNGEIVASSVHCVNDAWLIPQPYLTRDAGNFRFECEDYSYPNYRNFNSSCNLVYYAPEEYEALYSESI